MNTTRPRRHAKPSTMRWGDHDSRTCVVCGRRLRLQDTFDARQVFDDRGRWVGAVSWCADHMAGGSK